MISFFGTLIRIFLHVFRSKRIILSENALLKLVSVRTGGVEAPNMDCITTITDRRRKGWNKSASRVSPRTTNGNQRLVVRVFCHPAEHLNVFQNQLTHFSRHPLLVLL